MPLLSAHGQVLGIHRETGTPVLTNAREWTRDDTLIETVELDQPLPGHDKFETFLLNRVDAVPCSVRQAELSDAEVLLHPTERFATFSRDGRYACAHPVAVGNQLIWDATQISRWEQFLPISDQDLQILLWIFANDWIHEGRVIRRDEIEFIDGLKLRIGPLELDLRLHVPFTAADTKPFNLVVFREGWRVTELFVYRPLMFFTAFRSPDVLEQLYLSLRSLVTFGGYDGHVHLITDQDKSTILERVPELAPEKLSVQAFEPHDWVGYVASKYCILDYAPAWEFQPLVFNDPDITFDAPIESMLTAVASQHRIAAPAEDFSPLRTSVANGATLLQRDLRDTRFAVGFNAGTLAFSNLAAHRRALESVRHVLSNHALLHGRSYNRWVDQETVNYVLYCLGVVDTHFMNNHVRFGWPGTEESTVGRRGLTHFWPSHTKRETMERYEQTLLAGREA